MTLSTALFVAAGFIFAKIRNVMKVLGVIKPLMEEIKEQKDNHVKFQLDVKSSIDALSNKMDKQKEEVEKKIDNNSSEINNKLVTLKDEQYKIKDDTHKMIMEYLFDLRKKTDLH